MIIKKKMSFHSIDFNAVCRLFAYKKTFTPYILYL